MPSILYPSGLPVDDSKCGCKGIRWCLICRPEEDLSHNVNDNQSSIYYYCRQCGDKAWLDPSHSGHTSSDYISIDGIFLIEEVIDHNQENSFAAEIDQYPWVVSQSGRLKQDFGPKVNFRKQKVKLGKFRGFPRYANSLIRQLISQHKILSDFVPVELCHLEYSPERGSCIDPHLDDSWLWGERLVTVNLLSDTYLTLTPTQLTRESNFEICVPMPARSLIVLSGQARHKLYHSIKREHIISRRLAVTFRELTPLFMPGGDQYDSIGKDLIEVGSKII